MTAATPSRVSPALRAALICSAAGGAQFIAARAARDALYLSYMRVESLPTVVVAGALASALVLAATAPLSARLPPVRVVSALFGLSTVLLLGEWMLLTHAPRVAVVLLYLHQAAIGPMLGSGVWLLISERFDPRTARRRFGQIQAAGTVGGLLGGLLSERVAAAFGLASALPLIAVLNMSCAWAAVRLAGQGQRQNPARAGDHPDLHPEPPRSGVRVLATTPYLRHLAAIMVLGTAAATIVDVSFKATVAGALDHTALLRFFTWYYAVTAVIALLLQLGTTRVVLDRLGLGWAAAAPSLALAGGSAAILWAPALPVAAAVRGTEAVVHASWYRAAYEVLFVPLSPRDRRAAKSLIDVGGDRLGDAVGGTMTRLVMAVTPNAAPVLSGLALAVSAVAAVVAFRVRAGYVKALERSLADRAASIDLPAVVDSLTRLSVARARASVAPSAGATLPVDDTEDTRLVALQDDDPARVRRALRRLSPLDRTLVPAAIALLARDDVVGAARAALSAVVDAHVDLLVQALLDPDQRFVVRRRLPDVLRHATHPDAVRGLLQGLADPRFEVRFRCARALFALRHTPATPRDTRAILDALRREVAVSRDVWQGRRLLDGLDGDDVHDDRDAWLRVRADRAMTHVMTLLCLILPREPVELAFAGLHAADAHVRGTALEYLESVLPPDVKGGLWQFLEDDRPPDRPVRSREQVLADLLGSHQSLALGVEAARKAASRPPTPGE